MARRWTACVLAVAALGCGSEGGPAMPEVAPELAAPVAQAPEPEPAPPEPGVRIEPIPELSVLTASLVEHLRAIRATSDRRQDDVFMKVGDSSTVSRGFLECFSSPDEVDLAGREELEATLAHFRNRHAGSRDSYRRVSRAAHEGWSARHVLDGDPSPLLQEVRAIRPRFAFVMNGGNDVEGADDYRYAQRMLRIVEGLEANGVIPILSAISPRRDDPETERWVERYNTVGWAIARARRLPYLDYHQLMMRLPRLGLAGDGVHPNIYPVDGRGRACVLDEAGLQYGHNARNLLALRGLDATRRAALEGADGSPDPPVEGDGTAASPREVRALPFAELVDTRTGGSRSIDRYACGDADESGREIVYRLVVDRPLAVRLLAVGREDVDVDVHLLRAEATGAACVERADREIEATLEPGTWLVSVDTFSEGGEARAGEALVVLSPRVEGPHGLD